MLSAFSLPAWKQDINSPTKVPFLPTSERGENTFIAKEEEGTEENLQALLDNPFLPSVPPVL